MKKILTIAAMTLTIVVFAQTNPLKPIEPKKVNRIVTIEDHKAIPLPVDDLILYYFSIPEESFYMLGIIEFQFDGTVTDEEKMKTLIKLAKEKYPAADGLIFTGFIKNKAEVIKFRSKNP